MRKGNISGDKREIEIELQTYSERKETHLKRERESVKNFVGDIKLWIKTNLLHKR